MSFLCSTFLGVHRGSLGHPVTGRAGGRHERKKPLHSDCKTGRFAGSTRIYVFFRGWETLKDQGFKRLQTHLRSRYCPISLLPVSIETHLSSSACSPLQLLALPGSGEFPKTRATCINGLKLTRHGWSDMFLVTQHNHVQGHVLLASGRLLA